MKTEPEWLTQAIEKARAEGRILSETAAKPPATPAQRGGKKAGAKRRKAALVAAAVERTRDYCAWTLPVETHPISNMSEWQERTRMTLAVRLAWAKAAAPHLDFLHTIATRYHDTPSYAIKSRFTRLSVAELDPANLGSAVKPCEDAVCLWLGAIPDRPPKWRPAYAQEKAAGYGVRVELWLEGAS